MVPFSELHVRSCVKRGSMIVIPTAEISPQDVKGGGEHRLPLFHA